MARHVPEATVLPSTFQTNPSCGSDTALARHQFAPRIKHPYRDGVQFVDPGSEVAVGTGDGVGMQSSSFPIANQDPCAVNACSGPIGDSASYYMRHGNPPRSHLTLP